MTGQYRTFIGRAASGLAFSVAGALLIGCASQPSAPAHSAAPATATPADGSGARSEASRSAKSSRTAKSKPASGSKKAPPRTEADKPVAAAKPDRRYQRPVSGAVVARFDGRSNKGLDFGGAKGDPVRAAGDGKVVFAAATLRGYGRLVMIKHDATYLSAYAHNSELLVKEGQTVKRGQLIARMGSSESPTVKLHFELRRNGTAIDPMPFLTAGGSADAATDD